MCLGCLEGSDMDSEYIDRKVAVFCGGTALSSMWPNFLRITNQVVFILPVSGPFPF